MPTSQSSNLNGQIIENSHIGFPKILPGIFSPRECDQIIELSGGNTQLEESSVGYGETDNRIDLYARSSKIRWAEPSNQTIWVYEKLRDTVIYVNQYYKFDIQGCMPIQITSYPVGGHFNWHNDIGDGDSSKRKLSVSVQLTDPRLYDGGDLEFLEAGLNKPEEQRQQGSAIIFPSYLSHRVSIITRGTRWALIAWFGGPPFR